VDRVTIDGSLDRRDATVRFFRGGTTRAVATVFRDRESLAAEVELERSIAPVERPQG